MAEQIVTKYPNPFKCIVRTSTINITAYHHCVLLLEAAIAKAVALLESDDYYYY